ncbi:hypothetical protein G9A89_016856 [Geosiphon pyriformis]|nr:hypothetical protein G9A89_016856 [Geosiphon pyriformis]
MKKTAKVSGFNNDFKPILPRKKRKDSALKDGSGSKIVSFKVQNSCSWSSKTGNTTESNSIDMEKECLVEKTSFKQKSREESGSIDTDMMPKDPKRIVTKCTLGKPLGTINFGIKNDNNDDILDGSLSLPPSLSLKHTVQVSVRKFFALDIDLRVVTGKLSQEKLAYVRKIFFGVNGFGRVSTPSKFGRIIWTSFISDEAMMTAAKLANDHSVIVNINLKRSGNNHTNWAIVIKEIPVETSVETVHMAVSEFGVIKMIKMQLVGLWQKAIIELEDQNQADLKDVVQVARADINKQSWDARDSFKALLYTLLMRTTAHNFYSRAHCVTVCFDSESDLVGVITTTLVIKGVGLYWSHLFQTSCTVCKDFGHTSLSCRSVKDAFRLARIYVKKSVPIFCPLAFGGKTWVLVVGASSVHTSHGAGMSLGFNKIGKLFSLVVNNLESCLVGIECSLVSLAGQISELAKRLESLMLTVFQSSSGCQLLVTSPSQNQGENIVMGVGLGEVTSDKIVPIVNSTASSHVVKLKEMLDGLFRSVLSLSAHFDSLALVGGVTSLTSSQ